MDVFGGAWEDHVEKLRDGFRRVTDDDTVILCGDLTWAMTTDEAEQDFRFIDELHGKKIILKGNHDYWFQTAAKAKTYFASLGLRDMPILNNNAFTYGDTAICGTRGWIYDENIDGTHNGKIMARETLRLIASLKAAGDREKLCFFHYPPRFGGYVCDGIVAAMREYGVRRCWYGHVHGHGHRSAVTGWVDGIEYNMVSADYVGFVPQEIII
jgi:predicted phosphohydrolase